MSRFQNICPFCRQLQFECDRVFVDLRRSCACNRTLRWWCGRLAPSPGVQPDARHSCGRTTN